MDLPHGYRGVEMVDGLKVELVCLRDGVFELRQGKGGNNLVNDHVRSTTSVNPYSRSRVSSAFSRICWLDLHSSGTDLLSQVRLKNSGIATIFQLSCRIPMIVNWWSQGKEKRQVGPWRGD